jgi:hypothetical protein
MPPLSKYDSKYHDDWAWSLAIKGATNEEIADAFGISVRTFIRWCNTFESLKDAVQKGKDISNSKVVRSLYERAIGITVEEKEESITIDRDGNARPAKIKKTTKRFPPDTMAIMYWLNNREREHWRQRQEITGADGSPLTPPNIVVNFVDPEEDGTDPSSD